MTLPDFKARLDRDLKSHETDVAMWRSRHQQRINQLQAEGKTELVEKLKSELNRMEFVWNANKEHIMNNWKVWKDSVLMREADKDFLRGIGVRALAAEESFKHMQAKHPSFTRPIVGYVEIHQWHNEGKEQVQDGFTTFQDLLDENRAMNWWTRKSDILSASRGNYLYAIMLGGTLKLINFNPDTSD